MDFSSIDNSSIRWLKDFKKMPERCQEMVFDYYNKCCINEPDRLFIFDVLGFPDPDDYESPIELILHFALDIIMAYHGIPYLTLYRQEEIKVDNNKYRVDFLFDTEFQELLKFQKDYKLVIECDGHEFHEKTKEQVKKRNDRDYNLKTADYDIIHFSGSEIYNEPYACALKILNIIRINAIPERSKNGKQENV